MRSKKDITDELSSYSLEALNSGAFTGLEGQLVVLNIILKLLTETMLDIRGSINEIEQCFLETNK